MANMDSSIDGPRLTPLGRAFVFLFVIGCIAGAVYLFMGKRSIVDAKNAIVSAFSPAPQVEIGIAYGTEKQQWLEWAVTQFAKTSDGKRIKIKLIPMGSLESAQALLNGDRRINVWAPASAAYKDTFVREWQQRYNDNPIVREQALALTPMVFVVWDERYQAFVRKYQSVSFDSVNQALQDKGAWDDIAHHPDWGNFKFGLANPTQSNSGLLMVLLAAYGYHHKTKNLTIQDVLDPGFQRWMGELEQGASGMSNSTGNLMQEMILKGPSSYDALFVYENVAIESLANAEGRWGKLRIVYPECNFWNENPYYIINASWSTPNQRKASDAFLNFLLSEPVQRESLKHGFRPASPIVPVKSLESPFIQYAGNGIRVDLPRVCEPARADVLDSLLASWRRAQARDKE